MSDLVGNLEDRFSHNEAQLKVPVALMFFESVRMCCNWLGITVIKSLYWRPKLQDIRLIVNKFGVFEDTGMSK